MTHEISKTPHVTLRTVLFSESSPAQTELCLRSLELSMFSGEPGSITEQDCWVLYRAGSRREYLQYETLKTLFPDTKWVSLQTFAADLHYILKDVEHVLFVKDTTIWVRRWHAMQVIAALREHTHEWLWMHSHTSRAGKRRKEYRVRSLRV